MAHAETGNASEPRFDLERIVPDRLSADDPLERQTLAIHRERYAFAATHVAGLRVLDIACGVGYGAALLKEAGAAEVTGVDVSAASIGYARRRYGAGVDFRVGDAFDWQPDTPVDAVVSLETIEHVADPARLLARFAGWLPAGGVLVGSVPVTMSTDINPYHLQDFTARGFAALLRDCGLEPFAELRQVQRITPAMIRAARRRGSRRDYQPGRNLPLYYLAHPLAALRRVANSLRYGFDVHYLALACRRR